MSIGITSIPTGRADTSPTDALRARRAQLLLQLATLEPAKNSASSALAAAERAFAAEQGQLLTAQQKLAAINARLLALSGQIADDQATIIKAKHDLGTLTRQTYESTATSSWVAAVLSATTFNQAMDRLAGTSHVAEQVRNLQTSVRAKQDAIASEKAEIQKDAASTLSLEGQLAQDSNALLMLVETRNAALQSASAPARAIENQIAEIDQQLAAGSAPKRSTAEGQSSCGNHFAYGQCTWYVASRRCIPWVGNAKDWFTNAARMGYPEGHTPQVGAVVTFWPGGDGASRVGHVGYVEAVGPASGVPAGYFRFSEMNYNGWNRVNYRTLPDNSGGIQGFIYAK
ncbi:MAG: CHAP domain-containing protein [Candidatus Dormibacteraeota bacterium]|nr:CHAP domain-containing protein [Candidatus Dormibacteraeota bacterium]